MARRCDAAPAAGLGQRSIRPVAIGAHIQTPRVDSGGWRVRRELFHPVTKGDLHRVKRSSGRTARHIVGVLLLALTMGQALVVLHGYAHTPAQTVDECSVCRLAAQPARGTETLVGLLEPHTISIELGATSYAPYVHPVHTRRIARAPPLSRSTSGAS